MNVKALSIVLLVGANLTAAAADQATPTTGAQGRSTTQAPIALSPAQMDQIVAGGNGPGTGDCTGTGIPKLDGTRPKYGKR
ncbi:hypothetical protein [uncultured Thiodictyon sp.]|uniref:hypothetical protein n=1 Tax=uncultured Thiodictyon sp. TaxID=1846217 RepID=UPI0025E0753D|nr:hypothetical protein [uncultured Thiodictyon sp.]